jgi:hypothetical protein
MRKQLTRKVHPLFLRQFFADAIRGQFVMSPAQHLLVFRAKQNIHDMTRAKFLVRAFDAREELLRGMVMSVSGVGAELQLSQLEQFSAE